MLAAQSVEKVAHGLGLDTRIKSEINRAPKPLWSDIGRYAKEQGWSVEKTREKVKEIRAEPERAQEILQPRIEVLEAPADKLIP